MAERSALAELRPALPPRLVAVAGAFAWWLALVDRPVAPLWDDALLWAALFGLAALLQALKLRKVPAVVRSGAAFPGPLNRTLRAGLRVVAVGAVVVLGTVWASAASRLPDTYNMAEHGEGGHAAGVHSGSGITPVAQSGGEPITKLTGPRTGTPEHRFTLTAQTTEITLPSGARTTGWTYNGTVPGPLLRVRQGALVQVTLKNKDVRAGVSLHWHGVDVPNAEDGVPGLTQNAVPVGGEHVYRFRAPDVGTYWYHSHQVSSEQVRKGLYGGFIVDSPTGAAEVTDVPVVVHTFKGGLQVMNGDDQLVRQAVPAGTATRLRLINTDSGTRHFAVTGTPLWVTAIDGTPVRRPTELTGDVLVAGGGARYDVEFTMPDAPVRLTTAGRPEAGLLISPDGTGQLAAAVGGPELDPTTYGSAKPVPFDAGSDYDQEITWYLDSQFGFYDGRFTAVYTVNGEAFPDIPTLSVREGELVRMRFVNRSFADHPMHLHGHHALVLARNGEPATGSPMWLDTVNVAPGETWDVAFKADNPGLWMDHCHNLDHAAVGMVMHLAYDGYSTPFLAGTATPNQPE